MKFEVVNDKGVTVMFTEMPSCVPDEPQLTSMQKAGYKFKIDDKAASIKKVKETLKTSNL